ncbi:MAG: thiamine-phosphate kinase [Alphaproteobacteria bacterium]|nr:thiamine-phosphate kinase [Alphaproteobacteria bacterium]
MLRSLKTGALGGEFDLIARYFAPLAGPGSFSLTDDAAELARPRGTLVLTSDTIVAGVHFLMTDPPGSIAQKLLRVSLSDLAAKGARPVGYLLSCGFPGSITPAWLSGFARGLKADQARYSITLMGGDTVRMPGPLTLSATLIGEAPRGGMIRRAGARPGDRLFVTGTIGDAGAGLRLLQGKAKAARARDAAMLTQRYRVPCPRVSVGAALAGIARAAIDVSDGLAADAGHLADVSGVKLAIDLAAVPLSPALMRLDGAAAARRAIVAGDDYEILFVAPAAKRGAIAALSEQSGIAITEIGRVERGKGVSFLDATGRAVPLTTAGYQHFGRSSGRQRPGD